MFSKLPASLLAFVLLGDFSCALRLNFEARRIPVERRGLYRRGSLSGSSPLDDSADLQYTTNITVGGASFDVMIDTGSSDLWVAGSVSSASDTGKAATISYASGGATGPVKLGSVDFAGYTVPKQAFIEVPPDDAHPAGQGLIGLGPSVGSVIYDEFDAADEGNTVLDSIFIQNTATPNFITFALGRLNDPTDFFTGDFTVGEILTNFTDVSNQPNSRSTSNRKQATVVVDTGFSLPQVPRQVSVAKAIYGSFKDAELINDPSIGQIWILPCTQEVNITLKFGGKAYPVHPLDAAVDPLTFGLDARQTSSGKKACLGLFQPVSFDTGKNPTYDIIFGMAFLRNVYTLINFGDFIADSTNKADPYIQFLSITDPAEAHSDFVKVRLNGTDDQPSVLSHNGSTDNNNDSSSSPSKKTYIIIGAAVLGAIVLLLIGAFIFKRSRSKQRGVYRPLHLPAPGAGQPQMYQQQPLYGGANPPVYNARPAGIFFSLLPPTRFRSEQASHGLDYLLTLTTSLTRGLLLSSHAVIGSVYLSYICVKSVGYAAR
ncbi:aspartic peptidase domain-containing protein [Mycena olivaceomarginata]|nr:aspartic peptidase domain-containing protein [Mycena olivaceomarginata]